ncbi:hypothetical protein L1049_014923 [Liquidambar formosana]|uniref:Protein kinase domain-containing protein n=1 Tax=Liquidambar formosana TaxID=63359 RepID=A0AAP0X639_LIQFO
MGFSRLQANLSLDGASHVRSDGILSVTNDSVKLLGHALYPTPLRFMQGKLLNGTSVATFSTLFSPSLLSILVLEAMGLGVRVGALVVRGWCFVVSCCTFVPCCALVTAHQVASLLHDDVLDDADTRCGIGSLNFVVGNKIEYDSYEMLLNVTISPPGISRPYRPLISFPVDLSLVLNEYMYIGFCASTGLLAACYNMLGWSFRIWGKSTRFKVVYRTGFAVSITMASVTLALLVISGAAHVLRTIRNGDEILKDWEVEYGARRFKYSELFSVTGGFGERNLIGSGGFGRVYKGVVPSTGLEVAIKRISHGSCQGMREFVAEITNMGRLRHRNLVHLHGWCRTQGEGRGRVRRSVDLTVKGLNFDGDWVSVKESRD